MPLFRLTVVYWAAALACLFPKLSLSSCPSLPASVVLACSHHAQLIICFSCCLLIVILSSRCDHYCRHPPRLGQWQHCHRCCHLSFLSLLNLWLTLKSMIRIITNYETVYLSIELMSCVFFLELLLFWDGGKQLSFLASYCLLVIVFANSAMGCMMVGVAFSDILLPSRLLCRG